MKRLYMDFPVHKNFFLEHSPLTGDLLERETSTQTNIAGYFANMSKITMPHLQQSNFHSSMSNMQICYWRIFFICKLDLKKCKRQIFTSYWYYPAGQVEWSLLVGKVFGSSTGLRTIRYMTHFSRACRKVGQMNFRRLEWIKLVLLIVDIMMNETYLKKRINAKSLFLVLVIVIGCG